MILDRQKKTRIKKKFQKKRNITALGIIKASSQKLDERKTETKKIKEPPKIKKNK
jgi:hypothetical protein